MSVAATKFPTFFEMRLVKLTFFKDLLEAISDRFSKAYFVFSDKGLGLDVQAVDTSGLALVALLLPFEAFDYYRCDRAVSGGLSLVDMAKAFRRANDDDILTIKAVGDRFNIVTFTLETPATGLIREYDFNCVDLDIGPLEITEPSESEYEATVRIPSAMFNGICNRLLSLAESGPVGVIISVDKEAVEFFTHGGAGMTKVFVSRQSLITVGKAKEPILKRSKEEVSLTFELRLMNSFSKASTLSDHVTIHLSSKQPAVFEYKILGMGYIRYYMMPCGISKEDEVQTAEDGN